MSNKRFFSICFQGQTNNGTFVFENECFATNGQFPSKFYIEQRLEANFGVRRPIIIAVSEFESEDDYNSFYGKTKSVAEENAELIKYLEDSLLLMDRDKEFGKISKVAEIIKKLTI